MTDSHKPFVSIQKGMRGYFAVHFWWNPQGFYEPWESGAGSYATKQEAIPEAQAWAEALDISFKE